MVAERGIGNQSPVVLCSRVGLALMIRRFFVILTVFLTMCLSFGVLAQNAKPIPDNPDLIAADQLYKAGKFAEAAEKYQALLKANAKLMPAEAGLIESLLHEQKVDEASAGINL